MFRVLSENAQLDSVIVREAGWGRHYHGCNRLETLTENPSAIRTTTTIRESTIGQGNSEQDVQVKDIVTTEVILGEGSFK